MPQPQGKDAPLFDLLFSCRPEAGLELSVYLVDDGSSDGTGDAVRQAYPSVSVIRGDGTLFWNRGMRKAWEDALKKNAFLPLAE